LGSKGFDDVEGIVDADDIPPPGVFDAKGFDCAANGEAAAGFDEAPNDEFGVEVCGFTPLG